MPRSALARHRASLGQLLRFGLVGGSGTLVNMATMVALTKALRGFAGLHAEDAALPLPGTAFNVRWYHVVYLVAFLVAVLWNFELNRRFTFRSHGRTRWWGEFWPFLVVASGAAAVGLLVVTLLMNSASPVALPRSVLDGSSGLRTPSYWAQAISILLVVPVNFLLSKAWAFKAVRAPRVAPDAPSARPSTEPPWGD